MLHNLATSAILGATKVQEHLTETLFPTVNPVTDSTPAEPNVDYPGHYCCNLYPAATWGGTPKKYCNETGQKKSWNLDSTYDNKVSSIYCGKNVEFSVCNNGVGSDCTGYNGMSGAGTVRTAQVGSNDAISSISLDVYDAAARGAVTVFEGVDCKANMGRFYAHENPNQTAWYTMGDMWARNIKNDQIDSVMVPYGYSVNLYPGDGFTGTPKTVKGDFGYDGATQGMSCIDVSSKFHD